MESKITYLIANYNNSKYIPDCLNSLLKQTSPNWQAFIYDDCSTDNSIEVIRPYLSDKIILITASKNRGKVYALTSLIESANTEIVSILDADDCIHRTATKELLQVYKNYPNAVLVYSRCVLTNDTLTHFQRVVGKAIPKNCNNLLIDSIQPIVSFKKKYYLKVPKMELSLKSAEDKDLFYKLEEIAPPIFIDKILYIYRRNFKSITLSDKNRAADDLLYVQKQALKRRNIKGYQKKIYLLLFGLTNCWYSRRYNFFIRCVFRLVYEIILSAIILQKIIFGKNKLMQE